MSLAADAVRGVHPVTAAVMPPLAPLPVYPERVEPTYADLVASYCADAVRPRWHLVGTTEHPYRLVVPGWAEDIAREQGTTLQATAAELWPHLAVDVEVVREL